jgi:hypothetical protein
MSKPPSQQGADGDASTEAPTDEPGVATPPTAKAWHERASLALAAFIPSVTIALINAFYFVRGAEMVVLPPDEILLYLDGEGPDAVPSFAFRIGMINAADGQHGDALLDAELQPTLGAPAYQFESVVAPIFAENVAECGAGHRCISLPGLTVVERGDEVIGIPGGTARSLYLSFPMSRPRCIGREQTCSDFSRLGQLLRMIAERPITLRVGLRFYDDGRRTLQCSVGNLDAEQLGFLRDNRWVTLPCQRSDVSGGPIL